MATIKVIGYKRVSTELQKEDGYSLEYQHQKNEETVGRMRSSHAAYSSIKCAFQGIEI